MTRIERLDLAHWIVVALTLVVLAVALVRLPDSSVRSLSLIALGGFVGRHIRVMWDGTFTRTRFVSGASRG